ncbi:MAG: serine--tRNA ligase [Chloroflexota bacterium]
MLDLKFIRSNPDLVRAGLKKKKAEANLDALLALDEQRRAKLTEAEQLKARRNAVSEEVGRLKKAGQNADQIIAEMRQVSDQIKAHDEALKAIDAEIEEILHRIPNLPHDSVPVGDDERANVEIRRWSEPRKFDFQPKPHWDIGTDLGILDFDRAGKITGARFTVYRGLGAKLERSLISFMLDLHTSEHGYTEILPPFMVNGDSAFGTGQLPKFKDDMFMVANNGYFLIPTAEVPVTNLHRDEIIAGEELPIKYCAYSPCFRAEAGAAGRDTRGLIRQHQFQKVELVKLTTPETSYDELEKLTNDAERVLQLLELPYRVVLLSSGDMTFSSAKTYDLEVWLPSYESYKEISSCSNFEAFQARRMNARYRPAGGGKAEFVHTLNGSGLAIGRTVSAILENCQQADGSVLIPKVLRPYMGVDAITRAR